MNALKKYDFYDENTQAETVMTLKDLALNTDLIPVKLREFSGADCVETRKGAGVHYAFTKDGQEGLVIVFKKNKGLTTLQASGKDTKLGDQAINYLVEHLSINSKKAFQLSLSGYTVDKLKILTDYFVEECQATYEHEYEQKEGIGTTKVKGPKSDTLTFNLYTNGTLTIQGRPVFLVSDLVQYLSDDDAMTQEELLKHVGEIFETKLTPSDAKTALEREFPNAYSCAGSTLKKMLGTAISMRGLPIAVDDYAVMSFPALKGLECFMKQSVLTACGDSWDNFGGVFDKPEKTYEVKPDVARKIACPVTCALLNECYTYFEAHRNGTFHAHAVEGATRIIANRDDAVRIMETALGLIESHSKKLLEKK